MGRYRLALMGLVMAVHAMAALAGQPGMPISFEDPALEAAVRGAIAKPTDDLTESDVVGTGFTSLVAVDAGITNLAGIEACLDLEVLNLAENQIFDLTPLAALTNLIDLNLNDNAGANLAPLASLANLQVLRVKNNGIVVLPDMAGMTSLQTLTIGDNLLTSLAPLGGLVDLRAVGAAGNQIAFIEEGDLPATVEELVLADNSLQGINGLATVKALEVLDVAGNILTDLSALTQNDGMGSGDTVDVSNNPLGNEALCVTIPALNAWWVDVTFTGVCEPAGEGEGEILEPHSADSNRDGRLALSEVLRAVQFYNVGAYACDSGGEDGYVPGTGARDCPPHASDFVPQDWSVSLSELLRLIQLFNGGGYYACPEGEDGFCVGLKGPVPNVVFLMLETLRANRIGASRGGVDVAPFMTGLAAQGAHFTHAIAPNPRTRPSIAALFSGLYPDTLVKGPDGPDHELFSLHDGIVTLGEWFSSLGYDCRGIYTNGNASDGLGFAQGFAPGRYMFMAEAPAVLVTDAALADLGAWEEPFFTYLHYFDPHGPYAPPVEYAEVFGPQPEITTAEEMNLSVMGFRDYVQKLFGAWVFDTTPADPVLGPSGVEAMHYRYDAEIRYLDDELSRLVTAIEAAYPNTIFVIVSDHGEALQDRELLIGHGHTLFEEQANVPLILRGPGIEPQVIDTPVETLGVLPTLATLMGVPPHPQWQSIDCFEQAAQQRPVYCNGLTFYESIAVQGEAVYANGLKLVDHTGLPAPALFDLENDPGETTDLSASRPGDFAALDALLQAHLDRVTPP